MSAGISTILLVEGDIVARSPLAQYLRDCGFRVVEATTGDEAKIVLKSPELKIQVVLADARTEGSGFILQRWIRNENLPVRVILAGSIDTFLERAGSLGQGGPAHTKPYEHQLIRDRVRQAIARRDRALRMEGDGEKPN